MIGTGSANTTTVSTLELADQGEGSVVVIDHAYYYVDGFVTRENGWNVYLYGTNSTIPWILYVGKEDLAEPMWEVL